MDYFTGERLCDICGVNIDICDLEILYEIHGVCWQEYRKQGVIYPMPGCIG